MKLNALQSAIVNHQLDGHQHDDYTTNVRLGKHGTLQEFAVLANVLRPERMTSRHFAEYLAGNSWLYRDKHVLDMGSGSGVLGVVMARFGARSVTCADVSTDAVNNTRLNMERLAHDTETHVVQSDLFQNIADTRFETIVFNHPFFATKPIDYIPVSRAMFDEGNLLLRFLEQASSFLEPCGQIIMPFLHIAGDTNDPGIHAQRFGYELNLLERSLIKTEFQCGEASIYLLANPC